MFEKATRMKLRFETTRGLLSTEDLWDLPLRGNISLDAVAQSVSKKIKSESTESFVDKTSSTNDPVLELKLEVVKHIIKVKLDEESQQKEAAVTREYNNRIHELIAARKDEELASKSVEELQKLLK